MEVLEILKNGEGFGNHRGSQNFREILDIVKHMVLENIYKLSYKTIWMLFRNPIVII